MRAGKILQNMRRRASEQNTSRNESITTTHADSTRPPFRWIAAERNGREDWRFSKLSAKGRAWSLKA